MRLVVARRLPPELLVVVANDVDSEVRRVAARRMTLSALPAMVGDPEPMVRLEVAERLPPERLHLLARDPDMRVRFTVAERIDLASLAAFRDDPELVIQELVAARLASSQQEEETNGPGT